MCVKNRHFWIKYDSMYGLKCHFAVGLWQCVAMLLTRHPKQPDLCCVGASASQPQPRPDPASASRHQLSTGQSEDRAGGHWPIRGQQTEASTQHFWSPLPASLRLRQQLGGSLTNQRRVQDCVGKWEDSVCDHVTWVEADWDGSQSDYTSYCRAQLEVTQSQQYNDILLDILIIKYQII